MILNGQSILFLPILHSACLICYGALAAYIFAKNPNALINRLCALILVCFMIWCMGKIVIHHPSTSGEVAGFFRQIVVVGAWSFGSFLLLFSMALTDREHLLRRQWLWIAVFTIPVLCIALQWYDGRILGYVHKSFGWGLSWKAGPWTALLLGYIFACMLLSIGLVFLFSLKADDAYRRIQCRLIAMCILASMLLGFGTNFLAPRFGWEIPDLAQNLGLFWTAGLVFAIARYHFLELDPSSAANEILATMSDALILADRKGAIITINPAGLVMLQGNQSDYVGSHLEVLFPAAEKNSYSASQIMAGGNLRDENGMMRTRNGHWIPVSLSVTNYCGPKEQPGGVIIIARDIAQRIEIQERLLQSRQILEARVKERTAELSDLNAQLTREIDQRKVAAAALKQSEEMFRLISEQSLLGIVILQYNRVVYANRAWTDTTEFSLDEMLGWDPKAFLAHVHPDDRPHMLEQAERKQAGEGPYEESYEWRLITKSGHEKWISMHSRPIHYGEGTAVLASMVDVTESKRIFLSLQDSEEKYRLLVENANDGVFITQEGLIQFVNPKACEMTGYAEAELLYAPLLQIIHHPERAFVKQRYQRLRQGDQRAATYGFRILNKAGDGVWAQNNAVRLKWKGRPATLSIVRDLSHQKKMENMLNHMQRLEAVGNLAGGIAHDFNNILSPILGFAEMLVEDLQPGSEQHEAASEIIAASKRARDLVRQILTFSRQKEIDFKAVDIKAVVTEAIKLARATIPRNIEIRRFIDPKCGPVQADPTQLHQVVMNLITNAYHAMLDEGGTLTVALRGGVHLESRAGASQTFIVLTVEDTGIGIEDSVIEKIFDPYYSTKEKGSGLGLPVVMGIVKNLGGTIEVQSSPGEGSRFDVHLPHSPLTQAPAGLADGDASPASGSERVMVIDDEERILLLYERILTKKGYSVEAFHNPRRALDAFQLNPSNYQLIITDMSMPGMTGQRLASKILGDHPDFPLILCTGYSDVLSADDAEAMGIRAYLMKPVSSADLLETVRRVLDSA